MKTFQDWIPVIVPVFVAIIAGCNAWALEIFKSNRQVLPKDEPDQIAKKLKEVAAIKRRKRLTIIMVLTSLIFEIYQIAALLIHPSNHPNFDAFVISVNVAMIFAYGILYVVMLVVDKTIHLIERISKLMEIFFAFAENSTTFSSEARESIKEMVKEIDSIKNKKRKKVAGLNKYRASVHPAFPLALSSFKSPPPRLNNPSTIPASPQTRLR